MPPHTFPRRGNSPATSKYFAAGLIAGFLALIVLLCLLCHFCLRRSRANKRGITRQGGDFFLPRGPIRPMMMELDPSLKSAPPPLPFSRDGLTASIVMPEKIITRKRRSSQNLSGKVVASQPSLFQPPPLSAQHPPSRISTGSPRPRSMSLLNPACTRQSRASSAFSIYAQHPSGRSNSRPPSFRSASPTYGVQAVRQLFEPTLPDELAVSRCGDYLTILQSFDDGWCLVAQDMSRSSRVSRLSAWMRAEGKTDGDEVDIGLVPAWVFIKPLQGVTVTRPFRSSSVNALLFGETPGDARNATISWSNFS